MENVHFIYISANYNKMYAAKNQGNSLLILYYLLGEWENKLKDRGGKVGEIIHDVMVAIWEANKVNYFYYIISPIVSLAGPLTSIMWIRFIHLTSDIIYIPTTILLS